MRPTHSADFSEEAIAKLPALSLLCHLGYQFIPPTDCDALRGSQFTTAHPASSKTSTHQVILLPILREFLASQTFPFAGTQHSLSKGAIDKIINQLDPAMNLGLLAANEQIYNALMYGVSVTEFIDGKKTTPTIQLIDWQHIERNAFHVTEEFIVQNTEGTGTRIPDIVCFVNGLPLVVIEAKRSSSSQIGKPTTDEAISQQIRNQEQKEIPHLFAYSQLLLAINGHEGLYATCNTQDKFWATWTEEDIGEAEFVALKNRTLSPAQLDLIFNHRPAHARSQYEAMINAGELMVTDQDRLLVSLLRPDRLLEMTRLFTLFDKKVGKIVARYQQVFGIKALIERITSFDDKGGREGGVIWHTTGSGKSFTMVFLSKALIWLEALAKCRVIIVTDRVDLEDQLSRTFASGGVLTDRDKKDAKATSGKRLAQQIGQGNERVIFSIINKFGSAINQPDCFNDSPDILVLVDEGHRSQNGENNIRMQQVLPNAAFVAFTGTPLLKDDKTENKFGNIIHSYTMQQAVADGTVTPLLYEERIPELNTNDQAIDAWFERCTKKLTDKQRADLKRKFAQKGQVYQAEGRITMIAYDISDHFQNFKYKGLKGQLACDSKASAIRYKLALDKIGVVTSVVAMSAPDTREGHSVVDQESNDIVQNWWVANVGKRDEKEYTQDIIEQFSRDDGPEIMIVVDKLLTGFDEPKNAVLYIDKPLKEHNLIQAIARVNRLHKNKSFGYLIDYRGILKELDTTIEKYQDLAERTQNGFDIDDLKGLYNRMDTEYKKLPHLHSEVWSYFDKVKNKLDAIALAHVLAPKIEDLNGTLTDLNLKKRDDFYAAHKQFTQCMKVALQSATYFEDTSFDKKRDIYKRDLRVFIEIYQLARTQADETINYDEYAQDLKALLDKHIGGIGIEESGGVYAVNNMGKGVKPEELTDDEARSKTDTITGRVVKTIEQDLADDPYAQEYFSKLLKKAIEEAKSMFDAPIKQYMLFTDFEQQVQARVIPELPSDFVDDAGKLNRHAQAYFGLFKHFFEEEWLVEQGLDEATRVSLAFDIDNEVNDAVATYSINPSEIDNAISKALLPKLYGTLGINHAQTLIESILKITRSGLAKGE